MNSCRDTKVWGSGSRTPSRALPFAIRPAKNSRNLAAAARAVADAPSAPARAGDPPEVGEECRRSANENATASRNRRPRPAPLFEAVTAGLSIDVAELKRARPHSVRPATSDASTVPLFELDERGDQPVGRRAEKEQHAVAALARDPMRPRSDGWSVLRTMW